MSYVLSGAPTSLGEVGAGDGVKLTGLGIPSFQPQNGDGLHSGVLLEARALVAGAGGGGNISMRAQRTMAGGMMSAGTHMRSVQVDVSVCLTGHSWTFVKYCIATAHKIAFQR